MDENEILEQIKAANEEKISDRFPDYPCDRCGKLNCTMFRDCSAWRVWSGNRWAEIEKFFGIVRKKRGKRT